MSNSFFDKKEKTYFTAKTPKKKTKLMTCIFKGCKNQFESYPHARYCEEHKDPLTRPVAKKKEEITTFNMKNVFTEATLIERACDCCGSPYRIMVYPSTYEYPKFCATHRSEYKRITWRLEHGES